jgi:hypothetical protein
MELHGESSAAILNRLYSVYENDDKTTVYSELAMVADGPRKGKLILIRRLYGVQLNLEGDDIYEDLEICRFVDLPVSCVYFKLFYGQRRETLRTLKGHRLVRGPESRQDILVNGAEWIPQINQMVNLEGESNVYSIIGYHQPSNKFLLQLADPRLAKADMIEHRASTPRHFSAAAERMTPIVLTRKQE